MKLEIRQCRSFSGRRFLKVILSANYWIIIGPWGIYLKRVKHFSSLSSYKAVLGVGFRPPRLITPNRW